MGSISPGEKDACSSEVALANQTKESEVCELSGNDSRTGSGTPFCLNAIQNRLTKGVPELIPDSVPESSRTSLLFGFGKRGLLEKGSFQKSPFSRDSREFREILEILENPQTVENKGESDLFLEILENIEILEILEIPPVKRPLS